MSDGDFLTELAPKHSTGVVGAQKDDIVVILIAPTHFLHVHVTH